MQPIEKQLSIIKNLVGDNVEIKIKEDGFLSRGYVIDNGRIVFKFPRNKDVSYEIEIKNLELIKSLNLDVNIQQVAYKSDNNEYLGVYGVAGNSLEDLKLSDSLQKDIGIQLGKFLKKLHGVDNNEIIICDLKTEIDCWQQRIISVNDFIINTFNENEQKIIYKLIFDYMPTKLYNLGEKLVFSHADLGDGNVFLDKNNKVGVIDFNTSGLLDEAGDFMDIKSDIIREYMLEAYGADNVLREKVEIRKDIRPLIVLKPYLSRNDKKVIDDLIIKIKKVIEKYKSLLN